MLVGYSRRNTVEPDPVGVFGSVLAWCGYVFDNDQQVTTLSDETILDAHHYLVWGTNVNGLHHQRGKHDSSQRQHT